MRASIRLKEQSRSKRQRLREDTYIIRFWDVIWEHKDNFHTSTTLDVPEEEPLSEEEYINFGLIGPAAILASSSEEEIKDE